MLARVNSFRADPSAHVGAAVMLGFAAWAGWRWANTGSLFFLLLLLRDVVASWFLLSRRPSIFQRNSNIPAALAYLSSALPLFYLGPSFVHSLIPYLLGSLLPVFGFALSTIALFDLGKSFGVAPASRGGVTSGVYGRFKHPMYIGYGIAEFGLVLLNPINVGIYLISIGLYWLRSKLEDAELIRSMPVV